MTDERAELLAALRQEVEHIQGCSQIIMSEAAVIDSVRLLTKAINHIESQAVAGEAVSANNESAQHYIELVEAFHRKMLRSMMRRRGP